MAAVLGGTQSLHTNSFDEAIALPTDFSARIARNTQLILAEESGITDVADPLGGSFYVEKLTSELADKAWALIEEVEAHGGMTKAVAEGLPKHRIEEAAAARAAKVDSGETVIVGVNRYRLAQEEEHDFLEVDNDKVRAGQIARIEQVRAGRDEASVRAALDALERAAKAPPRREAMGRGTAAEGMVEGPQRRDARWTPPPSSLRSSGPPPRSAARRMGGATCSPSRSKPRAPARRSARSRDALEQVFGRYGTKPEPVRGIYGRRARDRRWKPPKRARAPSPTGSAASRGSWSPRWARTGTTAAPTWSPPPSPTSASK